MRMRLRVVRGMICERMTKYATTRNSTNKSMVMALAGPVLWLHDLFRRTVGVCFGALDCPAFTSTLCKTANTSNRLSCSRGCNDDSFMHCLVWTIPGVGAAADATILLSYSVLHSGIALPCRQTYVSSLVGSSVNIDISNRIYCDEIRHVVSSR